MAEQNVPEEVLELLPTIYRDVAQASVQKIGKALSSIVGIITAPLIVGSAIAEENLNKLIQRLGKENLDDIVPVPTELGVPILERLKYTRGEELAKLYIELFVKASLKESQNRTHPSYFEIITSLSVDESKILSYLEKNFTNSEIPYIRVKGKLKDERGDIIVLKYFTLLSDSIKFFSPDNEQMYLENLVRLGILHDYGSRYLIDEKFYKPLSEHALIEKIKKSIETSGREMAIEKSYFELTDFGASFIKTCVPAG